RARWLLFFSSRRRHTRFSRDWSSDVCSSDLINKVKSARDSDTLLIGEDMQKIDYTLSACCNPIPGDDVFGFITVNDGIKIHRTKIGRASCRERLYVAMVHGRTERATVQHML